MLGQIENAKHDWFLLWLYGRLLKYMDLWRSVCYAPSWYLHHANMHHPDIWVILRVARKKILMLEPCIRRIIISTSPEAVSPIFNLFQSFSFYYTFQLLKLPEVSNARVPHSKMCPVITLSVQMESVPFLSLEQGMIKNLTQICPFYECKGNVLSGIGL